MKIHLSQIHQEIINEYKLDTFIHTDGYVYIYIHKGMYGLTQAGMLTNKLLKNVSQNLGITKSGISLAIGNIPGDY